MPEKQYIFLGDVANVLTDVDPNKVGHELEEIRNKNKQKRLVVNEVVSEADEHRDYELSKAFEWDDATAAKRFRHAQARFLINKLHLRRFSHTRKPVRAYLKLGKGGYRQTENVLQDETLRAELLELTFRKLGAIRERYDFLKELAKVYEEIDRARTRHRRRRAA